LLCFIWQKFLSKKYAKDYSLINAKHEVPAIELDGIRLTQSLPIIEYLDETRPHTPHLLPKDAVKRAKARLVAEIINSGIQPYQNTKARTLIKKYVADYDEKNNEWLRFFIGDGLRAVEEVLKETSGKYCIGDEISIADLCLVPQMYAAKQRFDVDVTQFPICCRINAQLEELEAFRKAHAHNQIDCPLELR
jgi:maleylacetoacetate isomerase